MALLLERFYELDGGKITIDGVDIKDCSPKWLRGRCIGFISQVYYSSNHLHIIILDLMRCNSKSSCS